MALRVMDEVMERTVAASVAAAWRRTVWMSARRAGTCVKRVLSSYGLFAERPRRESEATP